MAELLGSVERELGTDFACLATWQCFVDGILTSTYAASGPGMVVMMCGSKCPKLRVRLERWDSRPPPAGEEWEDSDELPWSALPNEGPLQIAGSDPAPDEPGMSVDGLDRARVEVFARGRHLYFWDDYPDDDPVPEEWLLRFWPDPDARDALAGPPRRIAGPLPDEYERSAWQVALHAWDQTGWHSYLSTFPAYSEIRTGLYHAGRPCTEREITECWGPWREERDAHGQYTWDSPVVGWPVASSHLYADERREKLRSLSAATGISPIETFADLLAVLVRLGLLTRLPDGRLVPNPAPDTRWDALDPAEQNVELARQCAALNDYRPFEEDIEHLLRWAPGGVLVATPRRIAIRLSIRATDVCGVLRLLALNRMIAIEPGPDSLDPDREVTVRRPPPQQPESFSSVDR